MRWFSLVSPRTALAATALVPIACANGIPLSELRDRLGVSSGGAGDDTAEGGSPEGGAPATPDMTTGGSGGTATQPSDTDGGVPPSSGGMGGSGGAAPSSNEAGSGGREAQGGAPMAGAPNGGASASDTGGSGGMETGGMGGMAGSGGTEMGGAPAEGGGGMGGMPVVDECPGTGSLGAFQVESGDLTACIDCSNQGGRIIDFEVPDVIRIQDVDLTCATEARFSLGAAVAGGAFEVRVDDAATGTLLGTVTNIPSTGNWATLQQIVLDLSNVPSGVHDVFLKATLGPGGWVCTPDAVEFWDAD